LEDSTIILKELQEPRKEAETSAAGKNCGYGSVQPAIFSAFF